jgi:hypothetical protein
MDAWMRQVEALLEAELAQQPQPLLIHELRAVVIAVVVRTVLRLESETLCTIALDEPPHEATVWRGL